MQIIINLDEILKEKKSSDILVFDEPVGNSFDINKAHMRLDKYYLEKAMQQTKGNKTQAAKLVNLTMPTFVNRLHLVTHRKA